MARQKRTYPAEFKRRTVEWVRSGRSPEELAKEFESSANRIRKWATQADIDEGLRAEGLSTAEREELRELFLMGSGADSHLVARGAADSRLTICMRDARESGLWQSGSRAVGLRGRRCFGGRQSRSRMEVDHPPDTGHPVTTSCGPPAWRALARPLPARRSPPRGAGPGSGGRPGAARLAPGRTPGGCPRPAHPAPGR
jgi:transposase-like protein